MRLVAPVAPTNARDRRYPAPARHTGALPMLDVLMLALAFGLFAAAIGYTYACERL
jgi:hypothetical protein